MSIGKAERERIDHIPNINPTPRKVRVDSMLGKASTDALQRIGKEAGKNHSLIVEEALWLYEQAWNAQQAGGSTSIDLGDGVERIVYITDDRG